ncbi:MAG: prepilin-type N-terminal cleavage/methylation domain-containing protein [Sedimentisphaerales bacterium]|nr:prepilin-type N-terminal cleavage/methylation domain-containing protein [Sedimentisphaerales bacterium]
MLKRLNKCSGGVTLIEIMASIAVLCVAVVGTGGYRYYSALDAKKASMQITAARAGLLLCENWRGLSGSESYDPTKHLSSDMKITSLSGSAAVAYASAKSFRLLGGYKIEINDADYYAVLMWNDVSPGLRALTVVVGCMAGGKEITTIADTSQLQLFELTTYACTG